MSILTWDENKLYLDGEPFYLASGDMHYFRFFPGGWRRRLELMKDFGLTAVQTYVPWDLHEKKPGEYDFSGMLDVAAWLRLCQELDLKVLFRPSGYMCSEWDMGGLPAWLLKDPDITLRSTDPRFMEPLERYTRRLCQEFVPYLSTNGGPIIAVALENEYMGYSDDTEYLCRYAELLRQCGVDVPLFATDGYSCLNKGLMDDSIWQAVNYRIESKKALAALREYQPDKPLLVGEYWAGRSMHWQDEFHHREPEPCAKGYRNALEAGAFLNFYMFAGGTNFGFMHGANWGKLGVDGPDMPWRYIPGMTSYDVDAPISENGVPTEKYYACRRELDRYLGKPERPACPPPYRTQQPESVRLTEEYRLFGHLSALTETKVNRTNVCNMEALDQSHGFILYSTTLRHTDDYWRTLAIHGLADRALIYVDGIYQGMHMRGSTDNPVRFQVAPGGSRLDILVENLGRINFGREIKDKKGINDCVELVLAPGTDALWRPYGMILNWEIRTLPLSDVTALWQQAADADGIPGDSPVFYRGSFRAEAGVDTFIDMHDWHMGFVWVNGFNLGRFWNAGPQQALYLPGELLKEENEICILELTPDHEPVARFSKEHMLVGNLTDQPVHAYQAEE